MPSSPQHSPSLLAGKVAVITGAGAGIGEACARVFVRYGAKVLAADISGGQESVAKELGASVVPCHLDVRQEDSIEAMFARALEAFGRVDILLCLAGNAGGRRGGETSAEEFDEIVSIHMRGMLLCNKHGVRAMRASGGGAIVNFSSVASMNEDVRISTAYSAAKAGINAITKSFAVRYGADGIRANAIMPGFTLSQKNLAAPPEVIERLSSNSALHRAGKPEEQAEVAAFLSSDLASFVTGVIIPVDGGWSARLA